MIRLCLLVLACGTHPVTASPTALTPLPTKTTAWQCELADLDGDGVDEILYAGYDGELVCMDGATGKARWRGDLGAFCYCLTTADLNGDGRPEVLATSASLHLHVFSPDGEPLWQFTVGAPLHSVAAGKMLDDGDCQVVCGGEDMKLHFLDVGGQKLKEIAVTVAPNIESIQHLALGDVTGDERNELCLTNGFGIVRLMDPRTGEVLWNSRDYARRFMRDLLLWDADSDGKKEVLAASERVELLDGDGSTLWTATPGGDFRRRGYMMAQLAPVDVEGDGTQEVAVLYGPELSVLNGRGERVEHHACDYFFFTSVAGHAQPSREVVLGSVVGADRNVYAVELGRGSNDELASFNHEHGYINTLNGNLAEIRAQVLAAAPNADLPQRVYRVWVSGGSPPWKQMGWVPRILRTFEEAYPYENLDFVSFLQYRESGYKGQGSQWPVEELTAIAQRLEEENAAHVLGVGHGLDAYMSLAMVDKWLRTAPTTCRGLLMSENSALVNHQADADEVLHQSMDAFVDDFMLPVMDLLLKRGKKLYLLEKQLWWVAVPATPKYAGRLFAEKYRPLIVPMVEESNSRCPELNFLARVGLWRSGYFPEWGLNVTDDQLRTCKQYEYTPCEAHATLRHCVAYVAAGATELKLGKLMYLFTAAAEDDRYGMRLGNLNYRPYGLLAFDTFMHLLGKGLLAAPAPDEFVGASPVAIRFHEPHRGFWLSARMRDFHRIEPESRGGLFTGFDWGFTKPHEHYAPAYLMNVPRHCHQFLPENPFGLPLIVPAGLPAEEMAWAEATIDTDGVHLLENGKALTGAEAKPSVLRAFEGAAAQMPFRVRDAYWAGRQTSPGTYRIVVVDPDYLAPRDREAKLSVSAPRELLSVNDVLTGERQAIGDDNAEIRVPAGAFRLLDVRLTP